ncbi:MAG: nuclear transport factor 2 family protein [Gemmatimonadetes bacterium]|nr:nuclear transport factor 2 family protein [Gemmatimonadota bacterium]
MTFRSRVARAFVALALVPASGLVAQDQTEDEQAVLATLERLFDAMRANDGDLARSVFAEGAVLISTEAGDGSPATSVRPAAGFIDAIGGASAEWDEPFWDPVVHVQDHLATVWTKYAFYLDGTFSHCGVDAVLFARGADGWKITALSDTRERENCELPPDLRR